MTPIADMVEQMLSRGLPAEVIVLAVATAERNALRNGVTLIDTPAAIKQRRYRQNIKEKQGSAEANDAAQRPPTERNALRNGVTAPCNLSSSLLSESPSGIQEVRKKKAAVVVEGRRGVRLAADAVMSNADRQFARDHGMSAPAIEQAWAEFVDYWIAVPGQRGCKTVDRGWPATWRNRVRQITTGNQKNGRNSVIAAADRLVERVRSLDAPAPAIRDGTGSTNVRVLPSR